MSTPRRRRACAAGVFVALLGLFAGAASAQVEIALEIETPTLLERRVVRVLQGYPLLAPLPLDPEAEIESVEVLEPPVHGEFIDYGENFQYQAYDPAFFGSDRMLLEVTTSKATLHLDLRVDVLPEEQPLAGRWQPNAPTTQGLYRPKHRDLVLCNGQTTGGDQVNMYTLVCYRYPVVGNFPSAVLAVVLPKTGTDADTLYLFDPATGVPWRLAASPDNTFLAIPQRGIPEAVDRFPVGGFWQGSGPAQLAFVSRDGEVGMLEASGEWSEWPTTLPAAAPDRMIWPLRWPIHASDRLGVLTDQAELVSVHADGTFWVETSSNSGPGANFDSRRPYFGRIASAPVTPEEQGEAMPFPIGIYAKVEILFAGENGERLTGTFNLGEGFDPAPSTIPVKFPNDPPTP